MMIFQRIHCLQELDTAPKAQQATDTLVFVRVFLKYLTESLNADDLVAFLDAPLRAARQQNPTELPGLLAPFEFLQ